MYQGTNSKKCVYLFYACAKRRHMSKISLNYNIYH